MSEVAAFLDRITYGDESTPGISETKKKWREMGKGKAYGAPSVNPPVYDKHRVDKPNKCETKR